MMLHFWLARRLRPGSGSTAPGTVIAIAGVALSLAVMELTLGIVLGFKQEIKHKLMGFDAQITIGAAYDPTQQTTDQWVNPDSTLLATITEVAPRAEVRTTLRTPAIIKTDTDFEGLIFTGQSPKADFSFERANIVDGRWPDYAADSCANDIVLSRATADALGLAVGDKVYTTFIVDQNIKMRRFRIAGLYRADFGEYDRTVAYASLDALRRVCDVDSLSGSAIELRGLAEDDIDVVAQALETAQMQELASGKTAAYHPVDTIHHTGAVYFNWLALLDTNVAVIFSLMLCVAAFTLISSLFIIALDKVQFIGILRAMGASRTMVRSVFVDLGMRIVLAGMLTGNIVGLGLLLVQRYTSVIPLDPEAYYLNAVPVAINVWQFVLLNIGVALVAWLTLWIPARTASSVDPAQTIKFE